MRIKLVVEYDGSDFSGWQFQPGLRTVQSEIEAAIKKVTGEDVRVTASGRTDTGVHALNQVVHFDTSKDLGAKFAGALNYYLAPDVRIKSAEVVWDDFHARFGAKRKTYDYVMYEGNTDSALWRKRAARVQGRLDEVAMNAAASFFVGQHDFACFMSSGSEVSTTVRTVMAASVVKKDGFVIFSVTADGFLYNMVRKMAAVLIEVGKGQSVDIPALLRREAATTKVAPPQGLYLREVTY